MCYTFPNVTLYFYPSKTPGPLLERLYLVALSLLQPLHQYMHSMSGTPMFSTPLSICLIPICLRASNFLIHLFHLLFYDARPLLLVLFSPLEAVGFSVYFFTFPYLSHFSKTCEMILEDHYPLLISSLPPIPPFLFLAHPQTKKYRVTTY